MVRASGVGASEDEGAVEAREGLKDGLAFDGARRALIEVTMLTGFMVAKRCCVEKMR
jgi:hypothetical protein